MRPNTLKPVDRTSQPAGRALRVGVISDTHGQLDPAVLPFFEGVDHILHAGDIGKPWLLVELEFIAPLTAVSGNTDQDLSYRETERLHLGGRSVLLRHIVPPPVPGQPLDLYYRGARPDLVVFGHTHRPFFAEHHGIWFLNPGSAGPDRFNLPRSVAMLEIENGSVTARFLNLDTRQPLVLPATKGKGSTPPPSA
jgi:putative phosphoesterase